MHGGRLFQRDRCANQGTGELLYFILLFLRLSYISSYSIEVSITLLRTRVDLRVSENAKIELMLQCWSQSHGSCSMQMNLTHLSSDLFADHLSLTHYHSESSQRVGRKRVRDFLLFLHLAIRRKRRTFLRHTHC